VARAFNGTVSKSGDIDHFAFSAQKGEVLEVNTFAFRIGSPLDTVVSVWNANGDMIAFNNDDETHDSRFSFTVPTDGVYTIRVLDKRKQGGSGFIYRIEVNKPSSGLAVFLLPPARKTQDRQVIIVPR
jgi:hypothetical protein